MKAAGRSAPTSWRFAGGKKKKNHSTTSPTAPTESQCNQTRTHWLCPCWSRGSFSSSAPFCLKNKTMEGNSGKGHSNPATASDFSLQCSLQPPAPKMVPTEMPGPFQCLKPSSPFFCWDLGSDHSPQPPVSSCGSCKAPAHEEEPTGRDGRAGGLGPVSSARLTLPEHRALAPREQQPSKLASKQLPCPQPPLRSVSARLLTSSYAT